MVGYGGKGVTCRVITDARLKGLLERIKVCGVPWADGGASQFNKTLCLHEEASVDCSQCRSRAER